MTDMETSESERFAIRLRGLPWSATDSEIIDFIQCPVVNGEDGIKRTFTKEGRPSGEAYVELYSQDDVIKCLDKDRAKMGKRYIEVFQSSIKEMDYVLSRGGDGNSESTRSGPGEYIVRLRGLPYQCSKDEVTQFFSGLDIAQNGISLLLDDSGRSTGEAYVEFSTAKGVEGALAKHKEKIGHRYIEIFKSNRREMNAAFGEYERPYMGRGRPSPYDRPRGTRMRSGRFLGRGSGMGGGYGRGRGGYGGYGDYYDGFEEDEDYSWQESGFGNGAGRHRGRGMGGMKGMGAARNYGGYGGYGGYEEDDDYYDDNSGGGMGSQTVHLRGLPFKASDDDISNFFSPIVPVRIHREYGKDGRVSGEADVEFASYQDAQAAMQKDGESMMHRYIELFLRGAVTQQRGIRNRRRGVGSGRGGYRY